MTVPHGATRTSTETDPNLARAEPRPGLLVVSSPTPDFIGRVITLPAPGVELGRGRPLADGTLLDDPYMSGRHASVRWDDDAFLVCDLGSRNGTFVDGRRADRARVRTGVVRAGSTFLQLVPDIRALEAQEPDDAVARELRGTSPELRALRDVVRQIAGLVVDVLVLGPPGAGKERVAAALHASRGRGPLVPVNCAAIPGELAESELFGHVRGAFSGAVSARQGAFQRADGGTLLLDEVGELPPAMQAKLLRALQDGRIRPVGSDREISVDVRVVSATNRDLVALVRQGTFRGDLYSRLARSVIRLPPLAERPADVVALAMFFLGPGRTLHPDAVADLLAHPWPHNVRDLQSIVSLLPAGEEPVRITAAAREKMALDRALVDQELPIAHEPAANAIDWPDDEAGRRAVLVRLLAEHQGNVAHVARALGRRPTSLYRWLREYGIDPDAHRRG